MVMESPLHCPVCRGQFGMIENCTACEGTGVDTRKTLPQPGENLDHAQLPERRPGPIINPRASKSPTKLDYGTIIALVVTIDRITEVLQNNGFAQSLEMDYDDHTVTSHLKQTMVKLIKTDETHNSQDEPVGPSDALVLARLLKRLNKLQNKIRKSTIG